MKRISTILSLFTLCFGTFLLSTSLIQAQVATPTLTEIELTQVESTGSATSTESAEASAAAVLEAELQEKKDADITTPASKEKSKLAAYLDEHPIGPLAWHNVLQHATRNAINNGLSANIIVLLILFPIIASIIATSRHIIGLQGFGVYIPAVLSVAFVSTGILPGLIIFLIVLLASIGMRVLLRHAKLQYLPRTAMMLWGVSLVTLALLLLASFFNVQSFLSLSIFPLLIIILLTENFTETQLKVSKEKAFNLTVETIILAVLCSLLVSSETVQQAVLLHPEVTILLVAVANFVVGRYTGLRLLEFVRFRSIMEK
ncbi:MAG: hypothetical protein H6774_04880 [Pseudomonadales bacterium]|nr:hypothetical protein [Candidatus Woesebacteria bacterium]MCB9802385.1 hypothetical protein [Pseudomonadales bacterium]